jgi:pyruvyltransferase
MIENPSEFPFIPPPRPLVKAYWWKGRTNWGDALTPLLLARFAHVEAVWSEPNAADVVCVGSILGNTISPSFKGTILGSGKMFVAGVVPPLAHILALRGPLTAKGVLGSFAIGDPGLLADELVRIETKKYDLCIVPHWSDKTLAKDPRFTQYEHIVVDSAWDPLTVIRTMAESKKVVSSSLHGLILADALNLPRRFEDSADWSAEGGAFKVRDHNEAVLVPFIVGKTQKADKYRVIDLKTDLRDAFRAYGKTVLLSGDEE